MDKNVLTVDKDPLHHGFWLLSLDRGALPDKFRGRYTKKAIALHAAQEYLDSRKKD